MNDRVVFVGNRRFVLKRMVETGINPSSVFVAEGTHLHRDLQNGHVAGISEYVSVSSKKELVSLLQRTHYDLLVSNGCPYILPLSDLPQARYVNIHPSCLPDLRGIDPVIGAILFRRDAGATCHVMDSGVDTGAIIAQVRIPFTDDLDVTTLYQLSFVAEQQVFSEALALGFEPQYDQPEDPRAIYYSRTPEDRLISFREPNDVMLQKIRAFNNRSQGCTFHVSGHTYRVFSAMRMHNPFLISFLENYPPCVVAMSFENGIVFRKDGEVMRFVDVVSANEEPISVGTNLLQP